MNIRQWTLPMKVLAYGVMSAISLAAIYIVDLRVHRGAIMPRMPAAPHADSAGR